MLVKNVEIDLKKDLNESKKDNLIPKKHQQPKSSKNRENHNPRK